MNAKERKAAIAQLESLKKGDFAWAIIDREKFPYRAPEVTRGGHTNVGRRVKPSLFYVGCNDYENPPNLVHEATFETAEEILDGFIIDGEPLASFAQGFEVNPRWIMAGD